MTTLLEPTTAPAPPRVRVGPAAPSATVHLMVRYFRDGESGLWGFAVESPAILGGGCYSRNEAEFMAVRAVARALARHPSTVAPNEETGYLHVEIRAVRPED